MSRPLIVNEAAAGDLRGKGKMRTAAFAHSLQCDNVKEWLDPFIKSSPSRQDPGADHRTSSRTAPDPPAPLLSPSRDGDRCKGSELTVLMLWAHPREWKGLSAVSYLNTSATSQTLTQAGPRNACVQACVCTLQSYTCKNANKKSGGLGLLKVSAACSKPHPESQIHNTIRQPTSKNSSCDFSLECSETLVKRYFCCTYSFIPLNWHSLVCTFAAGNARHFLVTPLAGSFTEEGHHGAAACQPGCWEQLQPYGPGRGKTKGGWQDKLGKSLDIAKLRFLLFIPAGSTDF